MSDYASYPSLNGMPVIISGGASGIGEGIVRAFAAQGSKVGFVDIAGEAGDKLAAELNAAGATTMFTRCDITDVGAYQAAIRGFEAAHGPTLALVNNAANDQRHQIKDITPEQWDQNIAVNLKHAFFAAQAVAPGMIAAGKGSIVNFGSVSWMTNSAELTVYTAAKAAMHGMSRSMAREYGPHGIRANTLVPGWIMTERQLSLWATPEALAMLDQAQPLKGRLYPEDIARMVLFLAADDSRMISGQDFLVDGGWAHG
ncbi:SDR family NAD(P)-dependent oxidoreductase [Devosia sp. ZB163]|uniref:SDR family NAD(P)-dependent oxidoreductase n=1 Tax=Devosia sp. ZB163 TaxID=3025938 RepID=UPI002360BCE1|nr:SDR family oxidoreductase [Devosia sp. ZB163]MDC9823491.1 SDR family NAD(P)-dependent oxidoreductase [Devosia sp. ZB163]